jgi:putative ABC transport system permease protein
VRGTDSLRSVREWLLRFWGTFSGRRADDDIEEELRLHLELAAEEIQRRGLSPDDAARAAAIAAGGRAQAMEALRDQRGLPWLDDLARDVRYTLRALRINPLFTAVALVTLALGIGANTAIFTLVNGVILRPLGYPKPEQLMFLNVYNPAFESGFPVAPAEYFEFRQINRSFAHVGAFTNREVNLTAADRPLRVRAAFVDAQLLNALGVKAAEGRLFTTGETEVTQPWFPGAEPPPAPVAILSDELWQRAFGGAPIVGHTIDVDGRRREVIGIMPPGADVMDLQTEIWLPLGLNPATRNFRGYHVLSVVGRLRDDITASAAQRELDTLMANWGEIVGLKPEDHIFMPAGTVFAHVLRMTPLQQAILGDASRSIWLLQAAVGLVLLIACSNLANLLLARAETRRREFSIRTALGASGGRLLRQSITEGMLLSIGGGLLGLNVASLAVNALIRAYPASLPRTSEVAIVRPVLLAALGVSLATGLIFGLVPFAHTRARHFSTALKEGGDRAGTGAARHVVRRGLVIVQVALAVMLVSGAALLVRTIYNLTYVDGGFDRSRLLTFSVTLPDAATTRTARPQAYQRLLATLRRLPGVQAATAMSQLPPNQHYDSEDTQIDNYVAPPEGPFENVDYYQSVMSDYFETMGIPILQGRSFQPSDAASSGMVAVVNERLVNRFWKGRNPIGQRLRPDWGDWVPWFTVIGVAKDVKQGGVDRNAGTEMYFFVDQMARAPSPLGRSPETINVVLRTTLPPSSLSSPIERAVHEIDPAVPVVRLRDMDAVFVESISRRRLLAQLLSAFAGLALLLAAVGTYGVFSYMVTERRREIAIRMALGAERSRVLAQIMKQGFQLTTLGVVAGLAGAFAVNQVIASMLFDVEPTDATTIGAVIVAIATVATLACWLPAFRASRLDPNVVLRAE